MSNVVSFPSGAPVEVREPDMSLKGAFSDVSEVIDAFHEGGVIDAEFLMSRLCDIHAVLAHHVLEEEEKGE